MQQKLNIFTWRVKREFKSEFVKVGGSFEIVRQKFTLAASEILSWQWLRVYHRCKYIAALDDFDQRRQSMNEWMVLLFPFLENSEIKWWTCTQLLQRLLHAFISTAPKSSFQTPHTNFSNPENEKPSTPFLRFSKRRSRSPSSDDGRQILRVRNSPLFQDYSIWCHPKWPACNVTPSVFFSYLLYFFCKSRPVNSPFWEMLPNSHQNFWFDT